MSSQRIGPSVGHIPDDVWVKIFLFTISADPQTLHDLLRVSEQFQRQVQLNQVMSIF